MACIWRLGEKNISGLGGVLHGISTPNHCMVSPWYLHLYIYIYWYLLSDGGTCAVLSLRHCIFYGRQKSAWCLV